MNNTVSAGGLIVRKAGNVFQALLVLGSDGKALIPKGHVERSETLKETAAREIKEEIGLESLEIGEEIGSYERFVPEHDELKTEHYFLIVLPPNANPKIQIEQDKDWTTKWFDKNNLPEFYIQQQKQIAIDGLSSLTNA